MRMRVGNHVVSCSFKHYCVFHSSSNKVRTNLPELSPSFHWGLLHRGRNIVSYNHEMGKVGNIVSTTKLGNHEIFLSLMEDIFGFWKALRVHATIFPTVDVQENIVIFKYFLVYARIE